MEIRAGHAGVDLPFERERRLVLRRIPVGAVVHRARLTVTPRSADPDGRFLETLALPPGSGRGDWGASKVVTGAAVEVDLHARRRLAAIESTGLAGAPLLVDIGAGFLDLAADGGLGPGAPFLLGAGSTTVPGMLATGLRVPAGGDVQAVTVTSPPSNVTVAIEGGPAVLTTFGDLVAPAGAEIGDVLAGLLPSLDVVDGCHVVVLVVRSDAISRLDVDLVVELALAGPATPGGLRTVRAAYRHDGTAVDGAGVLGVQVPPGMTVASVSGRALGAFDGTRVVLGPPAGAVLPVHVPVEAGHALAHPFTPGAALVASAVDLLLTALTSTAELSVDLVADQDGKPGRASLLTRPATVLLSRDEHGAPTWVDLRLAAPLDLVAGRRCWLTVQALDGRATWGAGPADGSDATGPGLQQTLDGGLSWRAVRDTPVGPAPAPGPLVAGMRLRHTLASFRVPLELLVTAGAVGEAVSLQRFAPTGAVDLDLDVPEVTTALNAVVAAAGGGSGAGLAEAVANGDFSDWYRVGTAVRSGRSATPPDGAVVASATGAFTPDGAQVLVLTRTMVDGEPRSARLLAVDPLSGQVLRDTEVAGGEPTALVVEPGGRRALVAAASAAMLTGATTPPSRLVPVDLATGLPAGRPVDVPEVVLQAVTSADGATLWLAGLTLGDPQVGTGLQTVVRTVAWSRLASGAAAPDWSALPSQTLVGVPTSLTAPASGGAVLVARTGTTATVRTWADPAALSTGDGQALDLPGAVAAAGTPRGTLLVLTETDLHELSAELRPLGEVPLPEGAAGVALALDPTGTVGLVGRVDGLLVLDVDRRRLTVADPVPPAGDEPVRVAFSPAGTHALVTRDGAPEVGLVTIGDALPAEWELTAGTVRPASLGDGEVVALLGRETIRKAAGPPQTSALAQVVPVRGGARHRFGFDAVALVDGARLEVRWTGAGCVPARTDRVSVPVLDVTRRSGLPRLPHVETVLVAPVGATQAEVRAVVPEGQMAVDHVTLTGTADALGAAWATDPALGQAAGADGLALTNGGAAPAGASQVVAVTAGATFTLEVRAVASGAPGAEVRLTFADDRGAAVGAPVVLALDPLDLDLHGASGVVPVGAVEVEVRVEVPVGASVLVRSAALAVATPLDVGLTFTSEAPGDLTVSDVVVVLDQAPPAPMPVPADGLCPVTPAGACHCQACGTTAPVVRARPAVTPAGRPASVSPCPTCAAGRVRLGGTAVAGAAPVALPRFRAVDRAGASSATRAALVSRLRVDAPLTEVDRVGETRAGQLRALGVRGVVELAAADPGLVGRLPGVSDQMATTIIASAAAIVRARGERVLFG